MCRNLPRFVVGLDSKCASFKFWLCHYVRQLGLVSIVCLALAASVDGRPFDIKDLLKLQDIQQVALSPDGKLAALVITRPRSLVEKYIGGRLRPMQRADVWILSLETNSPPRRVTNGVTDGSSFWSPSWSPDSTAIAMLSTRGSTKQVQIFVFYAYSDKLVRVPSEGGVDLETEIWNSGGVGIPMTVTGEAYPTPFAWLAGAKLITSISPPGSYSYAFAHGTDRLDKIKRLWELTQKGLPSYDMHFTDPDEEARTWPQDTLEEINIGDGRIEIVGSGLFRSIVLSPDKKQAVVICATKPIAEMSDDLLGWSRTPRQFPSFNYYHTKLGLAKLARNPSIHWIDDITDPTFNLSRVDGTIFPHPIWTKGSNFVLVLSRRLKSRDVLYVLSNEGHVQAIDGKAEDLELDLKNAVGEGDRYVLVRAAPQAAWDKLYVVDPAAERNHLRQLPLVTSSDSLAVLSTDKVVGINGCRLFVFSIDLGSTLDIQSPECFVDIPFPRAESVTPGGDGYVVVQTDKKEFYRLSLIGSSPHLTKVARPAPNAELAAATKTTTIDIARNADGTRVFSSSASAKPLLKLELNRFLADVDHIVVRDIPFQDGLGTKQTAKLFLPGSYTPGTRYPTLTWVYVSQLPSDEDLNPNTTYFANLALATSHGYAVLKPTINPTPFASKGRPYASLGQFVVPAVQAAIQYGYSDPSRIYLAGHSYGAYSTYALVTQTDVFAAAAAISGPSSLVGEYLSIGGDERYESYAFSHHSAVQAELETEHQSLLMGTNPMVDFEGYVANSPIRFADRVTTPLLIIHSDSDSFDMSMADAFYLALLRLSKPAAYMRIWGEPHVIDSPGNIAAVWKELFKWFDSHRKLSRGVVTN